jgi:hypothetical protein
MDLGKLTRFVRPNSWISSGSRQYFSSLNAHLAFALLMIIMLVHGEMFLFNNCINPLKSRIWQSEKNFALLIFNMALTKMIQRMLTFLIQK